MRKRTLALLGATGAMALGIAAPVAASAANDPKPRQQEFASELAKELGVDEAKVNAALDKVWADRDATAPGKGERQDLKTRLDQAVKDGKLTQAEADAVLKAVEGGILWPGWNGEWNGDRNGDRNGWNGWHGWNGHWDRSPDNQTK